MKGSKQNLIYSSIIKIISETNGVSLNSTLELLLASEELEAQTRLSIAEFKAKLDQFQIDPSNIETLIKHPVALAFAELFKNFPLKYREEHTHLTGALTPEFVYPKLMNLLAGSNANLYISKIDEVYGKGASNISTIDDLGQLMRLNEHELFDRYLEILILPKLVLTTRESHSEAAFSMAKDMYENHNVGAIRLKFTLSRATQTSKEVIPMGEDLSSVDVVLGLYDGFMQFKRENPDFKFILSPCFRKEASFFDAKHFKTKKEHFEAQVSDLLELLDSNPDLAEYVTEADTVGSEKELYRKEHFQEMKAGFRKLHSRGFKIRSHHGETWHSLRRGIQSVDNAMNIWQADAIEHGLSLGINPNYYYHRLYQRVMGKNMAKLPISKDSNDYYELLDINWTGKERILEKLFGGEKLTKNESLLFTKAKFHLATEMEHYQHDVLNRMIDKEISVIALPSSNKKLTGQMEDYKEHPFSWWEKKGMKLGVGTDNYITLNTNYIREMLILLFTDPVDLKITKLLMVCSGEKRRPYLSHLLWSMRKEALN